MYQSNNTKINTFFKLILIGWVLILFMVESSFAQPNKRIGIVYSEPSANQFYDKFAYTQLFMAMQHQAMMAGIPYDLLSEDDLTSISNLTGYDALLIPAMQYVTSSRIVTIEETLNQAVFEYGIGLVVSGHFMTNSENGEILSGDPHSRMKRLLGISYANSISNVAMEIRALDVSHKIMSNYIPNELIQSYNAIWFNSFLPVAGQNANVLAILNVGNQDYNGVLATRTGGRNVHFANDQVLGDTNLVWPSLRWVLYGDQIPVGLKMGRQKSLFISRNDMDESMFADDLHITEFPLYDLLVDWKEDYNFVGSYYLNIGNNPNEGQYTDWNVSGPLYTNYILLGNEIGTHSWTHPDYTSQLSHSELEFEFNQSKIEIGAQLDIEVLGTAIPGNPESLEVDQQLEQYFSYISGRSGTKGSGYHCAIGHMRPDSDMVYFSLNLSPDFTLIDFLGYNPDQAEAIWRDEYHALLKHAEQPIIHWLWHDYAPTSSSRSPLFWFLPPAKYSVAMFSNTIAMAHANDSEFLTLADMHERIKTFENTTLTVTGDNPVIASVNADNLGQFSLIVQSEQLISQIPNWYAYNDKQVFLPKNGGQFEIHLGASQVDVTRITALPMRAHLLSLSGNGTELSFTFDGEGVVSAHLNPALLSDLSVQGPSSFTLNGNQLIMDFDSADVHTVSINLSNGNSNIAPLANNQQVTTNQDLSVSITLIATDPDDDLLSYSVISEPEHGQISGTASNLSYTPNPGFVGNDNLIFKVNDGEFDSNTATVNIIINPAGTANQPPEASSQTVLTDQDISVEIILTASDQDGDPLTYAVLSEPVHGQLAGIAPYLTYIPNSGFSGDDSFTFKVEDGESDSNTATVSIRVSGIIFNFASELAIDGDLSDWNGFHSFGSDPNDVSGSNNLLDWLEGWIAHDEANFYLAFRNDGPITLSWGHNIYLDTDTNTSTGYYSDGHFAIGVDYLVQNNAIYRYTGSGNDWVWEFVGSITTAVNGNQAEFVIPRSLIGNPVDINLFFLGENVAYGGNSADYYPDDVTDSAGVTRFFSYTTRYDGNVPPTASNQSITMNEDATVSITLSGTDYNGDILSYLLTSAPTYGQLSGIAPNLTYTPNPDYIGNDSFTFNVNDGEFDSNTATVSIRVNQINDTISNPVSGITVDGDFSDWNGTISFGLDPNDISGSNNLLDWLEGWMAHDETNFYVAFRNDGPITLSWGHNIYLDTDTNTATGYNSYSNFSIGADYLIQNNAIYRYTGTGNDWSWEFVESITTAVNGNQAEFIIPAALIGNPADINLFFLGENAAYNSGETVDYYPNDAINPAGTIRFFRYTRGLDL